MTGRTPDRSTHWYGRRERQAKDLELSEACIARTPYDLEVALPCERTSRALGRRGQLSSLVMEKSWRLFLREWGEPADPIEYDLLFVFFLAKHRADSVWDIMVSEGLPGYRVMGALYTRMHRDLLVLGERLQAMRRRRLEAGTGDADDDDDEIDAEEAEERDEEEFRQQRQRDYDDAAAMDVNEAAMVLVDLPAHERDALLQAEEDRRAESRREWELLGIKSADDVKEFVMNLGPPPKMPGAGEPSVSRTDVAQPVGTGAGRTPPAPSPPQETTLVEGSTANWDERLEMDQRRADEAIEHLRQRYSSDAPTATLDPTSSCPSEAENSWIGRMRRQSDLDQQRYERIERVMKARAAQAVVAKDGGPSV